MKDKRTLLVIEDNELNRDMLNVILGDNYLVLEAENGKKGLEALKEYGSKISLIILDIQMPIMNGYEFLTAIKNEKTYLDVPIIVATSSDSDEEQIKCLEMGASDFVVKPYKPEIVKKRVKSLIRLRETALALHKVERDEITGLYNREAFLYHAEKSIKSNPEIEYDMICFEIEGFLSLQGKYGVDKCALAMKSIAEYLTKTTPNDAVIGKIDNAQIAALIQHMSKEDHIEISQKSEKNDFSETIPSITTNVGVYLNVNKESSVSTILSKAISPIDGIRHQYGKFIAFYDDEIRQKQKYNQLLIDSADAAIKEKQFKIYYQPKHNAFENKTGGAEALIRWIHPELGFISPGAFIPVFEKNGFISKIDLYVIETVCSDLRRWLDEGKKVVPVSANISQIDFDLPWLASVLEGIVDKYKIPHDLIHFEITESANANDREKKASAVNELHKKGFVVEMDDFGSGYSNLTTLAELPIEILKIDMSLVRNMFDPNHSAILKGVLFTARNLGMKIVAEGVETEEQAVELKKLCEGRIDLYYQGYYYSKPLPINEFEEYLKAH